MKPHVIGILVDLWRLKMEIEERFIVVNELQPFITCDEKTKKQILEHKDYYDKTFDNDFMFVPSRLHVKQTEQLQKLEEIININTVGWSSPRVLIDTIKREVFNK